MRSKTVFSLVTLSAGVLLAAEAPDALAKGRGGRKNRGETVRLATPASGPTTDAKGTITITQVKGAADAVLRLRGLDRRTTYQVVNGVTGDVLGEVRTNRKGRATFDLTPGVGGRATRAASADGSDGTDVPDVVDVVDPDTGDVVLTGDTTGDLQGLYGYATLGNATESVTITMGSDPYADMEYFTFTYFAPPTDDGWFAPVYDFWADTSSGELPLGAASVLDLAGKDFQVRDENGDVVFRGSLPDVEAYDIPDLPECPSIPEFPGEGGEWGGWEDWGADGNVPFDFTQWMDASGDGMGQFVLEGLFGGMSMNGRMGKRADPVTDPNDPGTDPGTEPPVVDVPVYTLWIEGADGFEKAGDLVAPQICPDPWEDDWSDDWNWDDSWDWNDDGSDWFWDWDPTGEWTDPAANGGKRHGRNRR